MTVSGSPTSLPGRSYETIVIGLGGLGSGIVYWLARRTGKVLGLQQFPLGHALGASEDHSRIIRLSYHTPGYVTLAREAYTAWAVVQADAGEQLIRRTGGLDLAPQDSAVPLAGYAASMDAAGVPFEWLDATEVMRRWPQFRLPEHVRGLYQADGGIAAAARCNAVHRRLAQEYGAVLRDETPVTSIRSVNAEVKVVAGGVAYRCGRLFIAADAWTNTLLAHLGVRLPLQTTQEQVTYFAASDAAAFDPERFPVWTWLDAPCFYGFPSFGLPGPKVAEDLGGAAVTPETRTFETDGDALERVQAFLQRHLPGALGPPLLTKTCLYTLTPDRDFVIDAVPGHPGIFVVLGAAHAFKFASLIGRIVAELVVEGSTSSDISPFTIDRPALSGENPPTRYLV